MNRRRLTRAERAAQFLPFSALKGFEEALRAAEQVKEPRVELSEEEAESLDRKLRELECGDVVTVRYYVEGTYQMLHGEIQKILPPEGRIVVKGTPIRIKDIIEVAESE